ncbi:hypothetical protein BMS3Abin05_01228 [bacterium BMS3Abin05]|nr:hypothetical protein BMS3Abin05_01228 [bacterium BMS3Abin05]GBE27527.1 hypothetical protein BMS3Bbin03_01454 [bacterium BMS3Bbin03]HDZ11424.1 zinc ribbon domain-containing protein [Bacteroidota bacterium]
MEIGKNEKECPGCALPVDKAADVCPYCGYEFPEQKSSLKWAAILLAIIFAYPLLRLLLRLLHL